MTNGESTDAEITAALEAVRTYRGPVRLDGFWSSGAWRLRWCGVLPESLNNTAGETIIRTKSWDRYVKIVGIALRAREPVNLQDPISALPSKPVGRQDRAGVRALDGRRSR